MSTEAAPPTATTADPAEAVQRPERHAENRTAAAVAMELDALLARLHEAVCLGFPAATDVDHRVLAPFLRFTLNNVGDPGVDGDYPRHTKDHERQVVSAVADLLWAPADDRWGYVTSGASEGTEHALWLARTRHRGAVVYHSGAAHHSTVNAIDRLAMTSVVVSTDAHGEIDYDALTRHVRRRRHRPAVIVANAGTGMSEAVDDVRRIVAVLDELAVVRRWIHTDAALSGIPLALLDRQERPGFDLHDGSTSVIVSGHKFLGTPVPCGVLVVRDSERAQARRAATYTGSPDSTLGNSRSGLAALAIWYSLHRHGITGLRERAERCRIVAAYTHHRLTDIGWPAHRHPHAFTVVLAEPPAAVARKWALASDAGQSHIVCMPGVTTAHIDAFIRDLRAATTPAAGAGEGGGSR